MDIEVFAPKSGDVTGIENRGFLVDLVVKFQETTPARTGAVLELTGPGPHANAAPFPGAFGAGKNDRFPGLIVLLSTTAIGTGPGRNLSA